jgi:hypothetical protein
MGFRGPAGVVDGAPPAALIGCQIGLHGLVNSIGTIVGRQIAGGFSSFQVKERACFLLGLSKRKYGDPVWVASIVGRADRLIVLASSLVAKASNPGAPF